MKRIPFDVIEAAKKSDSEAVSTICRHFDGYIRTQSRSTYIDLKGIPHEYFDDDLYYCARRDLISAIIRFKFKEPPEDYEP